MVEYGANTEPSIRAPTNTAKIRAFQRNGIGSNNARIMCTEKIRRRIFSVLSSLEVASRIRKCTEMVVKKRGTYLTCGLRTVRHFSLLRKPSNPTSSFFCKRAGQPDEIVARIISVSVEGSPSPALPPSSLLPGIFSPPKTRAAPHPHFSCVTDSLKMRT